MSRRVYPYVIVGLVTMLLAAWLAGAQVRAESPEDEKFVVAAGEVVEDDLYVAADQVVIDGTVKGDLIAFAQVVLINGTVEGDLIGFAQAIAVRGVVQDDARIAAQAFIVEKGGRIGDDINAAAYGIVFQEGSDVGGNAWLAASQVTAAGQIAGDLAGGAQSVHIAGSIGGDVDIGVADGEARPPFSITSFLPPLPQGFQLPDIPYGLSVTSDARIAGKLAYTSQVPITVPEGVVRGEIVHRLPEVPVEEKEQPAAFGSPAWAIEQVQRLLRLVLVGLLAVWLASRGLYRTTAALWTRPLSSLGWGILSPFAMLIFLIIAGLVILVVAVLLSYVLGSTALLTLLLSTATGTIVVIYLMLIFYIGALVTAFALSKRILATRVVHPIWLMLLGILILWVLTLIPVVGVFIGIVFALFGLGAIWLAVRRIGVETAETMATSG